VCEETRYDHILREMRCVFFEDSSIEQSKISSHPPEKERDHKKNSAKDALVTLKNCSFARLYS